MLEKMNQTNDTVVSANKEKLLSLFHEEDEIFIRSFIRLRLSLRFEGCYEELTDLIGVIKGPEVYCYACDEVIEKIDRTTPMRDVGKDTTKHLKAVHSIYQTVS